MNEQLKAVLASYGRSVLGSAVALYMAGVPLEDLLYSLIAALLPVALRYLNPKDAAFGRTLPPVEEIAEALSNVKVVKAPASKSQQKRVAVQTAQKPAPKKK